MPRSPFDPTAAALKVTCHGERTTRTVGELATRLDVPAGLVSRLLGDLERLGYIGRLPSPEDGRVKLVRATTTAQDLVVAVYARVRTKFHDLRDDLDDDRRREALQVWADNFGGFPPRSRGQPVEGSSANYGWPANPPLGRPEHGVYRRHAAP